MRYVKCANCGRTQKIGMMEDTQAKAMTPFERQRQRWFHVVGPDLVLCGGSLRVDGIDDGKDWCLHLHRENHSELYTRRVETIELFIPGMTDYVPKGAEKHVLEADDGSEDSGSSDRAVGGPGEPVSTA